MALLKTPLNEIHRSLGAKMVDFGGWDMPVANIEASSKNTAPYATALDYSTSATWVKSTCAARRRSISFST